MMSSESLRCGLYTGWERVPYAAKGAEILVGFGVTFNIFIAAEADSDRSWLDDVVGTVNSRSES